jgi:predicted transcriptional regulator
MNWTQYAKNMERDRTWVINEALDHYLATVRWQFKQLEEADKDISAGRTFSSEEVLDHVLRPAIPKKRKRAS